jgi:hypothetical protein
LKVNKILSLHFETYDLQIHCKVWLLLKVLW